MNVLTKDNSNRVATDDNGVLPVRCEKDVFNVVNVISTPLGLDSTELDFVNIVGMTYLVDDGDTTTKNYKNGDNRANSGQRIRDFTRIYNYVYNSFKFEENKLAFRKNLLPYLQSLYGLDLRGIMGLLPAFEMGLFVSNEAPGLGDNHYMLTAKGDSDEVLFGYLYINVDWEASRKYQQLGRSLRKHNKVQRTGYKPPKGSNTVIPFNNGKYKSYDKPFTCNLKEELEKLFSSNEKRRLSIFLKYVIQKHRILRLTDPMVQYVYKMDNVRSISLVKLD